MHVTDNRAPAAVPPIAAAAPVQRQKLPAAIIADGQLLVADMDGTLIGAPGHKKEPTLDESVAKEAIFDWLRAGGHMLVTTSGETERTLDRFARFIPKDLEGALVERRLLLATNSGASLLYYDGVRWSEDPNYQAKALPAPISIPDEGPLVERSVKVINSFFKELRENVSFVPGPLQQRYKPLLDTAKNHPKDFTLNELDTLNTDMVPRIEIRRALNKKIVQLAVIGIPVDLKYDVSGLGLGVGVEMCKVGVMTHEINVKGVDKALPIRWLQEDHKDKIGYPKFDMAKSVAIGDRPNHNDASLTKAVRAFVSVCERDQPDYIPAHVTLRIGGNQEGTRKLIIQLLAKADEFAKQKKMEPVLVAALDEAVQASK